MPAMSPKGLADRLTESDAGILDGVMLIDMKIARRADFDIDQRMPGELLQHMVEKADAGRDFGEARAVEIDADRDLGFLGLARDGAFAHELPGSAAVRGFLNRFQGNRV